MQETRRCRFDSWVRKIPWSRKWQPTPVFLPGKSHGRKSLVLPSIFSTSISVFSNESVLHIRWPKYWNFSFSISPSTEHSGLISFRLDWLDLLTVQGTLKSLFQHHSSKASILWHSAFFIVQLSHLYMTTGKNTVLTTWTFVGKVLSPIQCLGFQEKGWILSES